LPRSRHCARGREGVALYVREVDHTRSLILLERAAASSTRAAFVANVLPAMHVLFHADEMSHSDINTVTARVVHNSCYPTPVSAQPELLRVWETRPTEHPWVSHLTSRAGGEVRSVRLSELCSPSELSGSAFYQDFFRPRGIRYADYQAISNADGWAIGFAVCRYHRDFSDAEHDLFEHLRRPLGRIWDLVTRLEEAAAPAAAVSRPLANVLTPSEQRVAELVLLGWRTKPIAQALGVSPKAIEQHLTRIYRKASVGSRAEFISHRP
jgi:DNA-binding CsgD family transcriptional regulator